VTTATYRLPRPPSVNNLYYNTGRGGGRNIGEHYKRWKAEAASLVMVQRIGQERVSGPYALHAVFGRCFPFRARTDLGNLEKALSDLLVEMNVIDDDRLAEKITLEWGDVQCGCEVTISSVAFSPQRKQSVHKIASKA